MMSVKEFTNMEECCYMDDMFDKCIRKTVKDSFFCGKHKPLLFKTNEFVLLHSGNKKKILEDMMKLQNTLKWNMLIDMLIRGIRPHF
jgi:hypothetical protein